MVPIDRIMLCRRRRFSASTDESHADQHSPFRRAAVDRLADLGGQLAGISPAMARLDAVLPPIWSRANPIDIAGDADEARYAAALEPLLDDGENDAVPATNVPTALASAAAAAKSIVAVTERHRQNRVAAKPVFAMWSAAAVHRPRRSPRPAFQATRRNRARSRASCISCATGKRATC